MVGVRDRALLAVGDVPAGYPADTAFQEPRSRDLSWVDNIVAVLHHGRAQVIFQGDRGDAVFSQRHQGFTAQLDGLVDRRGRAGVHH